MYSTLAARGMGPEPRCISAAWGGEGRGACGGEERWRGVDSRRSRETERGRKYRPNYEAALMRNVSTIQLLLSKYLMWPSRLSSQCPPAFLCSSGDSSLSFLGNTQPCVCVSVCIRVCSRVTQVLTVHINDCTCAGM